jgi:hypothetical protein
MLLIPFGGLIITPLLSIGSDESQQNAQSIGIYTLLDFLFYRPIWIIMVWRRANASKVR